MVLIVDGVLPGARGAPAGRGRRGGRIEAALWAALGLAVAPRLLMFARRIFIDIYISMFMALTLLFFALAERYPGAAAAVPGADVRRVGLGVLTKGPVAVALPGAGVRALPARARAS